ncbi:LamG-like jellyroll fold domain-containing protein [Luteimicrobium subarcticum]|uniref:Glycosyl hydrolase family 2 n=1 Tax=Luteimicrobium subarcticum TaxID=620910 RepID=A0A2M8WVK4_9MICO|nr:LamG-like jellyroll fold domain-containing protein [Luteimicrobium subarcticum]PJI94957.1 glycosyl hydrolase family 2 [Luteimicrobium subarcticum]
MHYPPLSHTGRLRAVAVGVLALATAGALAPTSAFGAVATPAGQADSLAATRLAAAADDGTHGLRADYYTITNTSTFPLEAANLQTSVLDPDVDVSDMLPLYKAMTGKSENVGVRWSGYVTAPKTGDYTFSAIGDNGFRLWVGGSAASDELIDWWVNDWDKTQTASHTVHLEAGQPVPFTFEQFQATGGAYIHLSWESADAGVAKQAVPQSAFTPASDFQTYDVRASIPTNGKSVVLQLPGAVTGLDGLKDHLRVPIDGTDYPVTSVAAGSSASKVVVTLGAAVLGNSYGRVVYDGKGSLAVDGTAAPEFNALIDNASAYQLTTKWAKDVDPNNPLPEYPRPQLTRDAWQNLNGKWDFEPLAAADTAAPTSWTGAQTAVVPYPIESQLSGIQKHYDNFAYHRTFTVPSDWKVGDKANQQRLELNFGAVDYQTTVLVNGKVVAQHTGGYDAFSADITDYVKSGANDLVVRVTDTTTNQATGKQSANPSGIFYTPSSGIWQTVWMEPVQQAHVDSLTLTPQLSGTTAAPDDSLDVTALSAGASSSATVFVTAYDANGKKVAATSGGANEKLSLRITGSHRWTPDDPYLYSLKVQLKDGKSNDTVDSYAGIRSIGIKNIDGTNKIVLNGQQTFLLATLDQGFWPDGVYTAPTDEALKWDVQTTKDLGFNTIRKHIKVEPARWYYDADKIGMMVWQDMPSGSNTTDAQRTEWKSELQRMISQHVSDTSIIGWIPFNEGWGQWGISQAADVAASIKAQDPSRLVNTRSGQNCCNMPGDTMSGDIIDYHDYTGPGNPAPDATRAAIDGEHGGFSLATLGHMWAGGSINPYGEVTNSKSLTDAYVENTAKLVGYARDHLSGSVYTQLTDVEGELNGFFTYDRRISKMDKARVRAINQEVVAAGAGEPATKGRGGLVGVGAWSFDSTSGASVPDQSGRAGSATLSGGATLVAGKHGKAVALDGKTAQADASVPKLDTTQSYSISAWVRMDALPKAYATAVAADSVQASGSSPFFLQYSGSNNAQQGFAFSFPNGPRAIASDVKVQTGQWYHLVGVRDADAGTVAVYVNGTLASTQKTTETHATSGTISIGRGQWQGADVDFLQGAVDDVHVFDRALSAQDVAKLAAS